MSAGWVAIHRRLADRPLWLRQRFTQGQAWVDLILMASYHDHVAFPGNHPVPVARGQVLTSQVDLATRWKWNKKTVKRYLEGLKKDGMADFQTSKETDTGYTLITICNYGKYQDLKKTGVDIEQDTPLDIERAIERPSNGHPVPTINKGNNGNNLRCLADAQPAPAPAGANGKDGLQKARKFRPEIRALLDEFCQSYEAKWGMAYLPSSARDQRLLSELLNATSAEVVRSRMAAFFENGTKRTRDLGDYSVPAFRGAWNELGVLKARGEL